MTFEEALERIPAPGGGGCHPYLMTCANIAAREGMDPESVIVQISTAVPPGTRTVSEREIRDTVRKAYHDRLNGSRLPSTATHGVSFASMRRTASGILPEMLHPDTELSPEAVYAESPVTFNADDGRQQFIEVLTHLYSDHEHLFVGGVRDRDVYPVSTWMESVYQAKNLALPPHMIWNPMSGSPAMTTADTESYRCDASVCDYRYAVAEFDGLDLPTQIRFWAWSQLPVAALVYSGGKSYHAILKLPPITTKVAWDTIVKRTIYERWLVPLGVDRSCSNPSRLSRTPGAMRQDTGVLQRLIYLNPDATPLRIKA